MKKLFLAAAALSVLIGFTSVFVSCGSSNSPSSPSATATPTAIPTPAVYIYNTDLTTAQYFQTLMNANNYSVTLVLTTSAASLTYSNYSLVVIGYDTSPLLTTPSTTDWGGNTTATANQIFNSGVPVLGMGDGGSYFFQAEGLSKIDEGACGTNNGNPAVSVTNAANSIWSTPNVISTSGPVAVYSGTSVFIYEPYSPSGAGVTDIGEDSVNTGYFPLASQTSGAHNYMFWGYDVAPTGIMTTTGQKLFINACHYVH